MDPMAGVERLGSALRAELAHNILGRLRDADVVARAAGEVHWQLQRELAVHGCRQRLASVRILQPRVTR